MPEDVPGEPTGKKLSRRDFLKLAGLGGAGLALKPPEKAAHPESLVNFRFGDHLLSPQDITSSLSVILGETEEKELVFWHEGRGAFSDEYFRPDSLKNRLSAITAPSVGVTNREIQDHFNALEQAKSQGTELVITDFKHCVSLPPEWIEKRLAEIYRRGDRRLIGALLAASVGYFGVQGGLLKLQFALGERGEVNGGRSQKERQSLKRLIRGANLALLGGAVASGVATAASPEKTGLMSTEIRGFLASLGDEGARQFFRLIRVRDLSMVLNTIFSQELIHQSPDLSAKLQKEDKRSSAMLFFAGGGHRMAQQDYLMGEQYLLQELAAKARELIALSAERLQTAKPEEEESILDDWTILTSGFSYPIPTYALEESYRRGPSRELPFSPRAILWKELLLAAGKDRANPMLLKLGRRLIDEDIAFFSSGVAGRRLLELDLMVDRAKRMANPKESYVLGSLFGAGRESDTEPVLVLHEGIPFLLPRKEWSLG